MAAVRLYLDENLNPAIAEQLRLRGVDAVCARDMGSLGESDSSQWARATEAGRVLVTADIDFLQMAAEVTGHTGLIFGRQRTHSVGDWVKILELVSMVYTAEDLVNRIEFV